MWIQIVVFIIVLGIPLSVILILKLRRDIQKLPVTANMSIVENDYRQEFTEGYSLGILKSVDKCKNGTFRVEFYPIDVEQGEGVPKPTAQAVIIKQEYFKPFARGKLSGRRERIKLITRNPLLIPEELRGSIEGEWITKEGQLGYIKSVLGNMISSGDEAIAEAMKTYARGNISKATLAQMKEEYEKFRKIKTEQEMLPDKRDKF